MSEWARIQEANRVRLAREANERAQAQVELKANATPETLRHRDARVMDMMLARDVLTPEQYRAGIEICAVWSQITQGLFAKVQRYERSPQGGSVQDWRAGMITAYHERYIPWREEAAKVQVKCHTLADLVFLVAVDNYGADQIGRMWRIDGRRVKQLTRESLSRYAQIGGWLDVCGRSINAA